MIVKKQYGSWRHSRLWFLLPFTGAAALALALFRGGGNLYWGPVDSDLTNQFYPWQVFINRWIQQGVVPFWDPHVFNGYPTVETQQMLALNPVHFISLLLSPTWGLPFQMAVHTLVAALGMAWALLKWGRSSRLSAAVGAVIYAAGGVMAMRVAAGHFTVVAAMAWWPLSALSTLRLVRLSHSAGSQPAPQTTRSFRDAIRLSSITRLILTATRSMSHNLLCNPSFARLFVLSVIVHAMVFLAGGPQYIVYLFYIDMAVWTAAMRRKAWLSGLFTMGAVWFSALLMSAPQWLPAFWYLPHSARAGGVSSMSGLDFHPLKNLFLEALMPYPFGDDVTRGHLHFKNAWETSSYPGAAALILALAMLLRGAVWLGCRMARRGGCRTALSPFALAGITIFLAGFYMAVGGWLPGFGGFRDVTKARAVMAFGVAIMSASQVDSLARKGGLISKYCFLAALGFMGLIIMGWAGSLNDPAQFEATVKSFGIPFDPAGHKDYEIFLADPRPALLRYHLAFQHALITGILIPAAVFGLMIIFHRRSRWISLLAGILVLAVSGDILLSNGNKWLARHPWIEAQLPLPIKEYFQQKLADSQTGFPWRVVLHPGIINRTHHLDGFYEYRGYDPLMPTGGVNRIMAKGAEKLSEQERPLFRTKALEKAGVRFDAENWLPGISDIPTTSIREFSAASLFEITRSVRLETLPTGLYGPDVDGYHYLDPDQSDRQLSDNVKASLVEMASASPGAEPGSETETSASLQTARPDEFGIRIHLDKPGLVVFKNTWLPGWRVIVDGRDRGRALLANNWMCGAVVEKGPHDIIFRYRPVAWGFSWLLTAISACGLLACLFCRRLFPRFK